MTRITANDIELIHADLMTAKATIEIDKGEGTKQNPFLINMIAYNAEQAIEKTLKAIIRNAEPKQMKTALENAVKASIDDEETAKRYKITDDKINAIMQSHDTSLLFYAVCEIQPDFEKKHPVIMMNKRRLPHINELRHGESSVSYQNAVYVLYLNAKNLFKELEAEYMKENDVDRSAIRVKATVNYSELHYQVLFDTPLEPTESISEEDAPETMPVTAGDLMLVKADLMVAKAILDSSEGVRGNLYMANMAAAYAEHAIEKVMKAMLKEQGGFEHLLRGHNTTALFNAVASIRPHFAEKHEFLDANKRRLPHINRAVRYGEEGITYRDARGLLYVASNLCKEAEAELIEKTGITPEELNDAGRAYYATLESQRVNKPVPKWKKKGAEPPKKPTTPEDR